MTNAAVGHWKTTQLTSEWLTSLHFFVPLHHLPSSMAAIVPCVKVTSYSLYSECTVTKLAAGPQVVHQL